MTPKARVIVRLTSTPGHSDFYDTYIHANNVNLRNKPNYCDVAKIYLREPLNGRPNGPWHIGTLSYPVDTPGDVLLDINPKIGKFPDGPQHTVIVFYSPTPTKNIEFQQMVAECLGALLSSSPVHISIFAAERTATPISSIPSTSAFYGAGSKAPETIIECGFKKREYRGAGTWLGARLESYIPGETKGFGVAVRCGGATHWFIECAEFQEGDQMHWRSFQTALRGPRQASDPETAFTKTMDIVGAKNTALAFIFAASPQPQDMVPTTSTFQKAHMLHRLCQGWGVPRV